MAAPSGTVWGATQGSYGRIGLCINVTTNSATTYAGNVQVWFWSKYTVDDTSNTLYYDNLAAAGSATTSKGSLAVKTTVSSGSGWSTTNQVLLASYNFSYSKGTAVATRYIYAKLANIDRVGSTMYASGTLTVPKLATYAVKYNANGGTGAPSNQTKIHGITLTLSSTKPTRTGYTFQGWATSATGAVVFSPGGAYNNNNNNTLYAVWKANTYAVKYNANGGTGAPSNQTKTYGKTLTLSSTKPTRTGYTFQGWATSATATTANYKAGASYTTNAAVTLYAVWELAYIKPIIYNLAAARCDSTGAKLDSGTYALISFNWETTNDVTGITINWTTSSGSGTKTITPGGKSGVVSEIIGEGALSTESTYTIAVTVADGAGEEYSNDAKITLNGSALPFDAVKTDEGIGAAVGKPAERAGVFDVALEANFNKPVYGNVLGLNRLPAIPEGAELNDYMETGSWAIYSNAIAATVTCGGVLLGTSDNVPPAKACRFEVNSSTGEGIRAAEWSYLRQRLIPYNDDNAIWERDISRSSDNVWRYYDWWKSNLTPEASAKVYHTQKLLWGADLTGGMFMTSGHSITLTERISAQPNGIVLVFSAYESATDTNYGWECFFLPKLLISLTTAGHTFILGRGKFTRTGTKYLYINDTTITGHDDNNLTGTNNGITFANNKFVLRYVIGV